MKQRILSFALLLPLLAIASEPADREVSLAGVVAGENVTFTLKLDLDGLARGETLRLVDGSVALLDSVTPAGTEVRREGGGLVLTYVQSGWRSRPRSGKVTVTFAARSVAVGDWRRARFSIPVAPIRRVTLTGDRPDLEVRVDGARDLKRESAPGGGSVTSGFLGPGAEVGISWKTEIRQLDAELMASCEVTSVTTVSAGALRIKTIYQYQIAQGALTELVFTVPEVTITQVGGADIQDWRVDRSDPKAPRLRVTLGRPQRKEYALTVESERPLPALPCTLQVPVLSPMRVIRAGGTLLLGADSAIRIQPAGVTGLTQTDPNAFARDASLPVPARSLFAYQYAAMPYVLEVTLDDIVTALDADIGLVVTVTEGELTLDATVQIDVRDAPAREVKLLTDADSKWTVAAVNGPQVSESDVDTHAIEGGREIVVPFRQPVSDTVLLHVRFEQPFTPERTSFVVPRLSVPAARTQRGYIVVAADKGLRLVPRTVGELRDVHTASTPIRVEGAQQAYRFRETPWKLELGVERAKSAVHTEVFHLVSLGEGVMYVSAAITCHISGAPVQRLRFRVPASIPAIDVIGAGIDTWSRSNDVCTVQLANRTMGDYTLLITYDQPLNYRGADLNVGAIETCDTDSELGYVAVATSAGLKLTEQEALPQSLIRISRDELPPGYAATVTAPVIGAYKYVRRPHAATLRVTPLATEHLIDQVVDYLSLKTTIGRDGESVTRALYCVKNASRQYLFLRLPKAASLWTVRQILADGKTRDLAAQQSGDQLLLPVDRPRDPNTAVSVEVTYAEPGVRGRRQVRLTAPSLVETPVTYANWEIEAGDTLAIGDTSGNLTPQDGNRFRLPIASPGGRHVCRFYRTANLAGDEALSVAVLLVPTWMAGGSARVLTVAVLAGVLLLVVACVRRRAVWGALSLTAWSVAGIQTWPGVIVLGIAGVVLVLAAVCILLVRACRRWSARRRSARAARSVFQAPTEPPPLTPEDAPNANETQSGAVGLRVLMALGIASGLVLASAAGPSAAARGAKAAVAAVPAREPPSAPHPLLVARKLELAVQAPSIDPRSERTAAVSWKMIARVDEPGRYRVLNPGSVLVQAQVPAQTRLFTEGDLCFLDVARAGDYELAFETREGIVEREGRSELTLSAPPSLMNRFTVAVPAADMEIASEQAVGLKLTGSAGETRAEGVLDTFGSVVFSWRPRARVARLEQAVIYCDVNSIAFVRAGVVDLSTRANYQVVQGEIRELKLRIPAGVSVTSVSAPALATWSLDPATRQLVVILARPVSAPFPLSIGMQAPCGGLPYGVSLGVPVVENVQRQRGQFALAAPESILLRLGEIKAGELEGVTAVNTSDFAVAGNAAWTQALSGEPLRRAFRYDDPASVRIPLRAEPVQPEIRVNESGSFSVGDERNVLSSKLDLSVSKAGVFAVKLQLPAGYDIETLTGRDVSHWDDTRRSGHGVEIFFKRRVLGATTLNLVLTKQQRGIPEALDVPRVNVQDAGRHTGHLAVASERGVRLTIDEQQGISVRKPDAGELATPALLWFDILRPQWQVSLHTQVLAPSLKPELLHRVELAEGMLQHRIYLRYRIENAGVKIFRLRVPVREATLSVSGRNIARVMPLDSDPDAGAGRVWQVELHGKVEDTYSLTCFYQQPYDPASGGVTIHAFSPLGVSRQSAWLVVTGGGRVQVEPRGETDGLKVEDARSLSEDTFGAGDLSGAIRCYRALRPDYRCDLSVVRHGAAAVLPASVEQTRFVTVLSSSGKMLTHAAIDLKVGDLRFLKVQLPSPRSVLWAALVNGAEVRASRDGDLINVPLENLTANAMTSVSLIYADCLEGNRLAGRRALRAPRFPDVPLRNITWNFYVPSEYRHTFVEGDFDRVALASFSVKSFEKSDYEVYNKRVQVSSINVAVKNLKQVNDLLSSGKQREAQQALQLAVNTSQADPTLNEDARIQFGNVVRQQVKMGLVNRREALRRDNNIFDEQAPQGQPGFNDGNFNQQYVAKVEEQLTAQDRTALDRVAQRMVDQQAAAAGQGTAINIAMPEHGRELSFYRGLQSEKGGALQVVLRFARPSLPARIGACWPVLPVFLVFWGFLRLARRVNPERSRESGSQGFKTR